MRGIFPSYRVSNIIDGLLMPLKGGKIMKTMTRSQKVSDIASSIGIEGPIGNGLEIGTACHDAGMISILRIIAEQEMIKEKSSIVPSKITNEMAVSTEEKFKTVTNSLSQEQQDLLLEYDDEFTSYLGCYSEDYYIQGFISGFRFLMREIKFGNGRELLE